MAAYAYECETGEGIKYHAAKVVKVAKLDQCCVNSPCRHLGSEHHATEGYCQSGDLTAYDVPVHCPCVQFTVMTDLTECAECGAPIMGTDHGLCESCLDAMIADAEEAERERRCRRCGGDSYYCVCTTGWHPLGGMVW